MDLFYLVGYMVDMKNKLEILYEDNHIIVVIKPINVLSQGDSTNDLDMVNIIRSYLKEKYNKPGNVYVGLVHRLDRPTGGIMVFAKTSKAASRLCKSISDGVFSKSYLAVVSNFNKKSGTFCDYLKKDSNNNSVVTKKEDGKYSVLNYEVIKKIDNLSLVKIELITGRHHQIRVQFASRGYPLYGDQRYGKSDRKQLALYAYRLEFIHPVKKEKMIFERFPKYGIFRKFGDLNER